MSVGRELWRELTQKEGMLYEHGSIHEILKQYKEEGLTHELDGTVRKGNMKRLLFPVDTRAREWASRGVKIHDEHGERMYTLQGQ